MRNSNPRPIALSLIEVGELSVEDLWRRYRERGGNADVLELDAFIHDIPLLSGREVGILGLTLDELLPLPSTAGSSRRGKRSGTSVSPLTTMTKCLRIQDPAERWNREYSIICRLHELVSGLVRLRQRLMPGSSKPAAAAKRKLDRGGYFLPGRRHHSGHQLRGQAGDHSAPSHTAGSESRI